MNEKRAMARYHIHQFVKVDFNREEFLAAEGLNISAKGLLCRLGRPLSPGQKVFLMLNLGTPLAPMMVNLDAIVVWSRQEDSGWMGGVEFIDLDARQEDVLHEFLSNAPAELETRATGS